MTTLQKVIAGIVALALIVLIILGFTHKSATLGDATVSNYPTWYYNGIVIGKDNSLLTNLDFGQCSVLGQVSIATAHSESVTCSVPKALAGDKVVVTSTNASVGSSTAGFVISAASVATSGTISMTLSNVSGATATPTIGPVNYVLLR